MPAPPVPVSDDTGVASSLVNVGQQAGGAIGLAGGGMLACSAVASSLRSRPAPRPSRRARVFRGADPRARPRAGHRALPGYLVSAGILILPPVIALAVIRASHQDLSGTGARADR